MSAAAGDMTETGLRMMRARSESQLRFRFVEAVLEIQPANGVAIYAVDASGRALNPLASENTFPTDRLPPFPLGFDKRPPAAIAALQRQSAYRHGQTTFNDDEALRNRLFGANGRLLAFRLAASQTEDAGSGLRPGNGVAFFNVGILPDNGFAENANVLSHLFQTFVALHPLVEAFEQRASDQTRKNAEEGWKRIDDALSERLVGQSPQMGKLRSQIARCAGRDYAVLLEGETGTGKELAARALHRLSPRKAKAFVAENCAAIPESLMESELFGYEKGAFTGAEKARAGLIKKADGGTLFLDEIGDLPPALQAKLLRVLQERKLRPLGADTEHDVDFRLITATHRDLRAAVGEGTFRADLYHRIAQLAIKLPPLRDREGDIAYLAQYFLAEIAAREDEPVKAFTDEAMAELQTHSFPGNVRELQNFLLRCVLLARDEAEISLAQVREAHASLLAGAAPATVEPPDDANVDQGGLREMVGKAEADILARCFRRFHGNQADMAQALDVPRRTLSRKLARYGICAGDERITETHREEV
ncbi:sigma-54 interaction domain-containing protein [Martelella mangrovi]|uniref:Sigma-54-specific transcriptional regulator n=1 Tax=Martelella mangrovi TaxID=1397477 RepID=A0ABV2IC01_9HYPH